MKPGHGETPDVVSVGASLSADAQTEPSTSIKPRPGDLVVDRLCGGTQLRVVAIVEDELVMVPVNGTGSLTAPITDRWLVTEWDVYRRVLAALPPAVTGRVRDQDIRSIVDESVRQIAGAP